MTTQPRAQPPPTMDTLNTEPPAEQQPLLFGSEDEDEEDRLSAVGGAGRAPQRSPAPRPSAPSAETSAKLSGSWRQRNQWIVLALVSGACAAFNGVFAKLTTTELTGRMAHGLADAFGLPSIAAGVEVAARASFFGLNLAFNALMWTLFTKALARGHSATQVSVMNTSANFMLTALLGSAIFSEALPPLWWLGACMLVAGNVIIGRKDEAAGGAGGDDADGPQSSDLDEGGELSAIPHAAAAEAADIANNVNRVAATTGSVPTPTARHRALAGVSSASTSAATSYAPTGLRDEKEIGMRVQDEDVLDLNVDDL